MSKVSTDGPTRDRLTIDEFRRCIDDKSSGAVRISVGLVSTFEDAYRFVEFARSFVPFFNKLNK